MSEKAADAVGPAEEVAVVAGAEAEAQKVEEGDGKENNKKDAKDNKKKDARVLKPKKERAPYSGSIFLNADKKNIKKVLSIAKLKPFELNKQTGLGESWAQSTKKYSSEFTDFVVIVSKVSSELKTISVEKNVFFLSRFVMELRNPDFLQFFETRLLQNDPALLTLDRPCAEKITQDLKEMRVLITKTRSRKLNRSDQIVRVLAPGILHIEYDSPQIFQDMFGYICGNYVPSRDFFSFLQLYDISRLWECHALRVACVAHIKSCFSSLSRPQRHFLRGLVPVYPVLINFLQIFPDPSDPKRSLSSSLNSSSSSSSSSPSSSSK